MYTLYKHGIPHSLPSNNIMPTPKSKGFIDWKKSKARGIILCDLEPGGYLVDKGIVSAKDLFDWYKKMPEFEKVVFGQFKDRLADHRRQSAKDQKTMPTPINWRKTKARGIILRDLEPGGHLVEMDHVSAEDLFDWYKKMPEFERVVFGQFKDRLADHRKTSGRDREMARRDEEACCKDRELSPRKDRNTRGQLCFDLHPAKHLLRMDVANGVHHLMYPSKLQQTRPAYMEFQSKIFKHRIYQEERRKRFLNFLAEKREKERPTPSLSRSKLDLLGHVVRRKLPCGTHYG
jgi:hypothetical protein